MICKKNRRRFGKGRAGWRYKVARNPLGTVPHAPLASAPDEAFHPPALSMLDMHGGQVKI